LEDGVVRVFLRQRKRMERKETIKQKGKERKEGKEESKRISV